MILGQDPQIFQIGLDGFIWFIGIVEDVLDPLNIGRCKVRIIGWHELNGPGLPEKLSTYALPWAIPIRPVSHSHTPSDIRIRDWVFGFFLDGKLGQQPMILGVFPSIPQQPFATNG